MLRFALPLTLLFTLMIVVVQARPYDQTELYPLIVREDCSTPCFIGIQPGITTPDEAVALLAASGWTTELMNYGNSFRLPVQWKWGEAAPDIFRNVKNTFDGALAVRDGRVAYIELRTTLSAGQTWLEWGQPEWYSYVLKDRWPLGSPIPPDPFFSVYSNVVVLIPAECPYLRSFWTSEVNLIIGDTSAWLDTVLEARSMPNSEPMMYFMSRATRRFCRTI
jgi:hypothetical protein